MLVRTQNQRAPLLDAGSVHRHSGGNQPPGEQPAQRTGRPSVAQHIQNGRSAGRVARGERNGGRSAGQRRPAVRAAGGARRGGADGAALAAAA